MRTAAIIAIAFVLVVLLVWLFVTHRSFVTLRNLVQEGRRRIDLELNARYGLISDFVEIVAAHSSRCQGHRNGGTPQTHHRLPAQRSTNCQ